ncbi:hypothetical protein GNI_113440 [Gregarina niphandrodes]|uniref:Uncharacterized protein n=1 Tax=Gregarina niphandrodes TaxID=110365 RepID=A0A023B3J0_GRENI|nr:hypothetical protein GNI_113440 [Gregarina niphandrodes]EZG55402.1 hypothetical protein GNI_113440 [Gregarina niphandrodes]|eukprot:XP_011131576.1 hypothetical protein GNI_113440 [Gregarina niphandrodes]
MGLLNPDGTPKLGPDGKPLCILDKDGIPIATKDGGPLLDSNGKPIPGTGLANRIAEPTPETRDFGTTYNQTYQPNPIHVCPAANLPTPPPAAHPYTHTFWDCANHAWY